MKTKFYIMLAATAFLSLTSCQRDELQGGSISGEEVTVSISAVVPGDGGAVVKSVEDPGNGSEVNRCILEVYLLEGEDGSATASLYGTRHIVKMQDQKASFEDLNLITGQKYRFVLWADCVDNPDTEAGLAVDKFYETDAADGLQTVTMVTESYAGNEDKRDAFFYRSDNAVTVDGPADYTLQLKRPFGQLNIITTDYGLIPETHKEFLPEKVQLAYKSIPTGINLLTGELLSSDGSITTQEVTGTAVDIADLSVSGNSDARQLSFDYIFAPATGQHIIGGLTMSFLQNEGATSTGISDYTFENLPVQRNYRTNVSGALLTDRTGVDVVVEPGFGGDNEISEEAETIEIAQAAIDAGFTNIQILNPVEGEISLPDNNEEYSITFNEGTSGDITISGESFNGLLNIENKGGSSSDKLVINLPLGSASLDFGSWSNVEVTVADDTFIVNEEAEINTLTVNGGNVEIYGRVGSIDFQSDDSYVKVYTVYDAAAFEYAASHIPLNRCASIVLGDDIDLEGSAENKWTPIDAENTRFTELDGAGYTLSNLYVDNFTGNENVDPYYYGGLFYVLQGEVRSLTIDGAEVWCHRGGALVGRMDYGTVHDCHVRNAKVHSFQKAAGLIGFVSSSSKDVTVSGCSVTDCQVLTVAPEQGLYQAGGLIGYLQSHDRNVLVENCSVSGISFDKVYESPESVADKVYDMEQFYSHPFIGTVANFSRSLDSYDTYTIELRGNKVDQQMASIPTCDRTNDYVGWWAGYFNTTGSLYTPKLVIEGQTMDCWIEMTRLATQLMQGGDVNIWRPYDFTLDGNPYEDKKLEIRTPTNITLKPSAVVTVGRQQVQNYSKLTINGESSGSGDKMVTGTITGEEWLVYNNAGGTLTIDGGAYKSEKASDANGGVTIYNQGTCIINDGTFEALGYAVMNVSPGSNTSLTVNGGTFLTEGKITSYAIHTHGSRAVLNIYGGSIDGVSMVNGATVTIKGDNTVIYNDDGYYGVYIGRDVPSYNYPNVTIDGGYFSGYENMPDVYNGAGADGGNLIITGGFFRDNQAMLPEGYEYQSNVQTINGITYNYEVVKTN